MPVVFVLRALPGSELVTDLRGGESRITLWDGSTLPVVEVEETEGVEWPEIFQP